MKPHQLTAALLVSMSLTGCATLMHREAASPVDVTVYVPAGQPTSIDARYEALSSKDRGVAHQSHFQMVLNNRSDYILSVTAPKFEPRSMVIGRRITPWYWGNLGFLGATLLAMGVALNMDRMDRDSYLPGNTFFAMATAYVTVPAVLIGFGVDTVTQNMWEHAPTQEIKLSPAQPE